MMNINVNQPLSPQALGQIYMGNGQSPDQNESDLFMAGSDAYNYVQQQAKNMGIQDPKAYFNNLVTQQKLATTPSGFSMEMARQAGQFSPNSLPGQLAARNAMADQASAANDQQMQQTQLAQRAAALQKTPLPTSMNPAPDFAPGSFGAQTGMNSNQYAMMKRLGGVTAGNQFIGSGTAPIDPSTLTNDPRFQSLLTTHPDQASQVFSAITGGDLGQHMKQQAADMAAADEQQRNTVTSWIKDQSLRFNPSSNGYEMRELVPDIANPGHMTLSQNWTPLNPIQQEWVKKQAPNLMPMTTMDQRMATAAAAAKAKAGTGSTSSANVQQAPSGDPLTRQAMTNNPIGATAGNMMMSYADAWSQPGQSELMQHPMEAIDPAAYAAQNKQEYNWYGQNLDTSATRLAQGAGNIFGLRNENAPLTPMPMAQQSDVGTPQPSHVRTAAVVNTPQFRNLMRTNPAAARAIVQRLQGVGN